MFARFFAVFVLSLNITGAFAGNERPPGRSVAARINNCLPERTSTTRSFIKEFCVGQRIKFKSFQERLGANDLQHVMTFDPAVKGQPVGMVYASLNAAKTNFDEFYVFIDWGDHETNPARFPTRDDDDIDVKGVFRLADLNEGRTLLKMAGPNGGIPVISVKFRQWLSADGAGMVLDLRMLSEYNLFFSSKYSTRQVSLDVVQGAPQAYYRDAGCNQDSSCRGIAFDYVWTKLRSGALAKYLGINSLTFYGKVFSFKFPVAMTNL